jgi:hypothetical protein
MIRPAFQLDAFADVGLTNDLLAVLIDHHERDRLPALERLWLYYRNPLRRLGARGVLPAQAAGLPKRIVGAAGRGVADANSDDRAATSREVVVENDIAWRIHTMIDFMFGRPIAILSTARDERKRRLIERILDAVWEASGGIGLVQDLGLLGHVYGFVDLVVRAGSFPAGSPAPATFDAASDDGRVRAAAGAVRIEVVEPTRAVPLISPRDFRALDAFVLRFQRESTDVGASPRSLTGESSTAEFFTGAESGAAAGVWRRLFGRGATHPGPRSAGRRRLQTVTEIFTGARRRLFLDEGDGPRLLEDEPNGVTPGQTPVVHIQNISQPLRYEGLSEVEALIPLQDELNARLSDRANRVTMQSFKMYLARGIAGFESMPVGPGQIWSTDNEEASVEAFGGDASSPSEDAHIGEIREAMDKQSGVPPLATGVVRAKIGNLSSENALRVTLMGLLSKTARKRVTYGRGIGEACRLVLAALHEAGVFETDESEREVRVQWPDPLPRNENDALLAAEKKVALGVSRDVILAELGYAPGDAGID